MQDTTGVEEKKATYSVDQKSKSVGEKISPTTVQETTLLKDMKAAAPVVQGQEEEKKRLSKTTSPPQTDVKTLSVIHSIKEVLGLIVTQMIQVNEL